jgi:hypothetical protein
MYSGIVAEILRQNTLLESGSAQIKMIGNVETVLYATSEDRQL